MNKSSQFVDKLVSMLNQCTLEEDGIAWNTYDNGNERSTTFLCCFLSESQQIINHWSFVYRIFYQQTESSGKGYPFQLFQAQQFSQLSETAELLVSKA
jgi:hypothetical protein